MIGLRRITLSNRGALALVLAGCLLGSLAGELLRPRTARAQVPDSGAQRNQMITELQAIHRKLSDLEALLKSGEVAVTVVEESAKRPPVPQAGVL